MNDESTRVVHWSFWVIAVVAFVWNAMGVMNYLMQMSTDSLSTFAESHRAIIEGRPAWATGGFAIGVFAGTLGCLLLLLRKSAAFYLFVVSLFGVIVTIVHTFNVVGSVDYSPFEIMMMLVMPLVVAAFLIWYSKVAEGRGWIRSG